MTDTVIIIGAGVAGLAAGCYAQMNGYRSQIFELHDLPGGLCTAWERKDYVFDGCIHYLLGSAPGQPFHAIWQELGALQGRPMVNHDELMQVVDRDGRTFHAYCDPDRLAQHIAELSLADARLGQQLADGVRLFTRFDMSLLRQKPQSLMGPLDWAQLGGQFVDGKMRRRYSGRLPIHSQVQVSLGVKRDLSAEPHWATYLLDQPVTIAGEERHDIGVKHYCFDPSLAPAGKSVVEVMLRSDYDYWQRIYGRKLYDTEQIQVCDQVIDFLATRYPGIGGDVEVKDVATPLSYERYTGNWLGSTCGWLLTKDTMRMMISGVGQTLPGLANFYHCGQWVEPGGMVPMAAISGRNVVQLLCRADGRPFADHG
jgi:phytoene dehydrogenase-like protein